MSFSREQLERYDRQILLENIDLAGQEKLRAGKILLIGVGGLGSAAALYLAAAGVGTLGLVDNDAVELSNLQRQIIHNTCDIGKPKIFSAQEKIRKLNQEVKVNTHRILAAEQNISELIQSYDFIIDATDNFAAKFLINDACVLAKKPFSHGGISGWTGQAMTYMPGAACCRCVLDAPPAQGPREGVLGAIAGALGSIQAADALKYLLGAGELLTNKLLVLDILSMHFRVVKIKPNCPLCRK